ncbi:Phage tail tube protein, TTP [Roseateles sp. YR242]|uniref:phage tail protein n=1 Tax=Roseateles sp. YR242 TaxID=1855305 RepID=UPI0008D6C6E6|nr:phage tail protein [Roseateles sp. YR242]SEL12037.1 Phage tail tube protein, TTP [Roseateles sp. YR242]
MAVSLPNGTTFAMASGYGTAIVMSDVSNATEAVATLAAGHGLVVGDYAEVTSGWSRLTGRIMKVKAVATNQVTFAKLNTSNVNSYPATLGAGTVRKITGWTPIQQITNTSKDGGEQQFVTFQFLEADSEGRIPTVKSASGMTIQIADDPDLPGFALLQLANDDRQPRALKAALPNTKEILYNGYVGFDDNPSMTPNEIMACPMTHSFVGRPHRV